LMIGLGRRGAEQKVRERARWQVGPGTARAPLRMLLPLQLGIVRVAEHSRACFGCVNRFAGCAGGHGLRRQPSRNSATRRHKPVPGSTLDTRFGPLRLKTGMPIVVFADAPLARKRAVGRPGPKPRLAATV